MQCSTWREAISAILDGEDPGLDPAAVESHLRSCAGCSTFRDGATALVGQTRLAAAEPIPDRAPQIVSATWAGRSGWRRDIVRSVLVGLGVLEVVTGLTALFAGSGASIHQSRELGAFAIAIGVGVLLAAYRPWRIAGLLPVVAVLAVTSVAAGVVDVAAGRAGVDDEAHHLIELGAVLVLWLLTGPAPWAPRPRSARLA